MKKSLSSQYGWFVKSLENHEPQRRWAFLFPPRWKLWNTSRSRASSQTWGIWLSWPSGSLCRRGPDSRVSDANPERPVLYFLFSFLCTYRWVSLLLCQWSEEVGAVKSIRIYSCSLSTASVSLHNWPSDGPLEKNRGMQVTSLFSGRVNWKKNLEKQSTLKELLCPFPDLLYVKTGFWLDFKYADRLKEKKARFEILWGFDGKYTATE